MGKLSHGCWTWAPGFMIEQHVLINPEPSLLSLSCYTSLPLTDVFKGTKCKLSLYVLTKWSLACLNFDCFVNKLWEFWGVEEIAQSVMYLPCWWEERTWVQIPRAKWGPGVSHTSVTSVLEVWRQADPWIYWATSASELQTQWEILPHK